jgi:hypothetical protein
MNNQGYQQKNFQRPKKTIETPKTPLRLCSQLIHQRIIDGALARIYLTSLPRIADYVGWESVAFVSIHHRTIEYGQLSWRYPLIKSCKNLVNVRSWQ